MNWTQKSTKIFFLVATVWNLSAAVVALIAPAYHARTFFTNALPDDLHSIAAINTQAFWVCVLLFGVGYFMAAMNPQANRGVIWLGALGKTYVGILWLYTFSQGMTTPFSLSGAVGDLVFAGLFFHYLWFTRK